MLRRTATAVVAVAVLSGCAAASGDSPTAAPTPTATPEANPEAGSATTSTGPERSTPRPAVPTKPAEPEPLHTDGRPRPSTLSIPAVGVLDLRVVPYRGTPDDRPGTEIQDGGVAASPYGSGGLVGPGGIGNYVVTAHRLSSTQAFLDLPTLRPGERVHVTAGATRLTYEIVRTRWTSFRSPRSLAAQSAAVPGRPGEEPTRAMITLSTCATPEDHARGNYWADEFDNPEHRIDKIGVLVADRPS